MKFTALLHHLTIDLLREGFYSLKRKAAPGADGVTWQEYVPRPGRSLGRSSQPGASRGIPSDALEKGVHRERRWAAATPIRGAGMEDKIVQQAVVTILNQIRGAASIKRWMRCRTRSGRKKNPDPRNLIHRAWELNRSDRSVIELQEHIRGIFWLIWCICGRYRRHIQEQGRGS